ncbi:DarT ssDNA thymidine ADP-ribosyltransferase family protein [Tianweitania populi]|uniref:DarT domain-containing protein n=1 Tax=Tianweitania populi TaxID=1607949 RepID=A0A8J3DSA6_9HYPH|nr:DarT ssDNA thymidine ADP-ribosyltransferase family protein [Tianweitania populi]GHD21315.1 hypothetical protein GCM10016234_34840 [Tianweitania populi]
MEVLAYQTFIFVTIVVARFAIPSYLIAVCTVWTAFTLLNLFYPPLVGLQLIVVWGTYAFVKPNDEPVGEKAAEATPQKRLPERPEAAAVPYAPQKEAAKAAGSSAANMPFSFSGAAAATMADLEQSINLANAVQTATRELAQTVDSERIHVEAAYAAAIRQVEHAREVAAMEPQLKALYEENFSRFDKALQGAKEIRKEQASRELVRPPVFSHVPEHSSPDVQARIDLKVEALRMKRETFIRDMQKKAHASPDLFNAFIAALLNEQTWPLVGTFAAQFPQPAALKAQAGSAARKPAATALEDAEGKAPRLGTALESRTGQEVRASAERRRVPFLVHFTRIENLRSICQAGVLPVTTLGERRIPFSRNDLARYDRRPGAVSLSVAHANDRMFYKYRRENPDQDWVVLKLSPSILWTKKAAFCPLNAADSRVSRRPLGDLLTPSAFEAMFDEEVGGSRRESAWMELFDPTDVQAEVLVFEGIEPSGIEELVFSKPELAARYQDCLEGRKATICAEGSGFFGTRAFARKNLRTVS